jgi:flagellar hook-basal body complex protein FliE
MVIHPLQSAESSALSSLSSLSAPEAPTPVGDLGSAGGAAPAPSFTSVLTSAVGEANRLDFAASQKVDALASGAIDDLHGTMISVKEADIALKLVGTVRSKILDAFQELWRTSV